MIHKLTHPSVLATAAAGGVLAAASTQVGVPGWLWACWAVLGAAAIVQAARS